MQRVFYAGDFIATQLIGWFTMELSNQLDVMLASCEPFNISMVMYSRDKNILGRDGDAWTCLLPRWNALSLTNVDCKTAYIFVQIKNVVAVKQKSWSEGENKVYSERWRGRLEKPTLRRNKRLFCSLWHLLLWQIFEFSFCLFFLTGR